MTTEHRLRSGIAAARAQVAEGDLAGARQRLEELAADPLLRMLGPQTALGLPRRLQAALLHLAKAEGDLLLRAGYQFHLVPPPDLLAPCAQMPPGAQAGLTQASRTPVPRVIHQIWIGPLADPPGLAAWAVHAGAQGYAHRIWRADDLAAFGIDRDQVFAAMLARGDYPGAVDVARYRILALEGGIYLDCDWYPARDDLGFHDLLPLIGLTALAEDVPRLTGSGGLLLANSFIAAPPGHPALCRLVEVLPEVLARLPPDAPAWWSTGPLPFTLLARSAAISLAPPTLVSGSLPRGAPIADVAALRAGAAARTPGLLLNWKSW